MYQSININRILSRIKNLLQLNNKKSTQLKMSKRKKNEQKIWRHFSKEDIYMYIYIWLLNT